MFTLQKSLAILVCVLISAITSIATAHPLQESGLEETVNALQNLLENPEADISKDDEKVFAAGRQQVLSDKIREIRRQTSGQSASDIMIEQGAGKFIYETLESVTTVEFVFSKTRPVRVESLTTKTKDTSTIPPLTWDSLDKTFEDAEANGFSGAVLLTRDGKIQFHKAYGFANREKEIKNSIDTVFAIGSAPIDFTNASLLILRDEGKLKFEDPVSSYFDNVPDDKKSITIKHLMTGRSGLRDFHDLPGDREPDHSWIDRDEAVRRIMDQELLFEPGKGDAHSHSAWGLLAAIVEIASGQTYQDFTRTRLYEPAGMNDTGFFGDKIDEAKIAVGYGHRKSSEPNSPPNWGKTSWLVMGSGGQISTLADMHRWEVAIRSGKVLSPESAKEFTGNNNRVSSDGDMYGFEFVHSHNPESMFMLISNSIASREDMERFRTFGRGLYELTKRPAGNQNTPSKYSLGIAMAVNDSGNGVRVKVNRIVAGSPAEKGGLQVDDILVSVNGVELGELEDVLFPPLNEGKRLTFIVLRGGEEVEVSVQPEKK